MEVRVAEDGVMPEGSVPSRREDPHVEAQWNRGDAGTIMAEARRRFKKNVKVDAAAAFVALASTHYSLVKRYVSPAPISVRHLAVWHMWRAAANVRTALDLGLNSFDQVDVCATILSKAPWWLGGNLSIAHRLVKSAIEYSAPSESAEMLPHTRAFLLIRLAEIEMKLFGRHMADVKRHYDEAAALVPEIERESDNLMADRQLSRILPSIGFFYWDTKTHMSVVDPIQVEGVRLIRYGYALARIRARDQVPKIMEGCRLRGIRLPG